MAWTFLFSMMSMINLSTPSENPEELGDVDWGRSLEAAIEKSKAEEKPILILFQEIPGCATCRNYGNNVLSDPYLVEAIETYFVPLAIYNNKKGEDARVLKQFGEPAWNNPVVRIVNADLKDVHPRLNGVYTASGLLKYMNRALIATQGNVPGWLDLIEQEYNVVDGELETAYYSMYCFWTGEAHFGRKQGVYATEAGFANGKEVVEVKFNPAEVSKSELSKYATQSSCKYEAKVDEYRADRTPKYYLMNSRYKSITMTELQAARVNSALGERQDPSEFLSPRQLAQVRRS